MKHIIILFGLFLNFTVACNDNGKSDQNKKVEAADNATTPESEAREVCACKKKVAAAFDKSDEEVGKILKECQPKYVALEKKYRGKGNDDEKLVEKIITDCEKEMRGTSLKKSINSQK